MSSPIGETLAAGAADHDGGSRGVVHAQLDAVVVAEGELVEVSLEVLLAAVLINTFHAALEDAKEALDGVGGDIATGILARAMMHRLMGGKRLGDRRIQAALIGVQPALGVDVRQQHGLEVVGGDVLDVERAGLTATLDQGEDRTLLLGQVALEQRAALAAFAQDRRLSLAQIRLIGLHDLAFAAHRLRLGRSRRHRLADAVRHEPSGLVGDAEHPAKLRRRHALLGSCHQVEAKDPLGKRNVAALHDRADRDREVLPAAVALMQTGAVALALQARDAVRCATVGQKAPFGQRRPSRCFRAAVSSWKIGSVRLTVMAASLGRATIRCIGPLCQRDNWEFSP